MSDLYDPLARELVELIHETMLSEAIYNYLYYDTNDRLQVIAFDAVQTVLKKLTPDEYETFKNVLLTRAKTLLTDKVTHTIHNMTAQVPF